MTSQIRICKYRAENRDELLQLMEHLWGRTKKLRSAYFDWKYAGNPYTDDINIYVAFDGRKMAGAVGTFGMKLVYANQAKPVPCTCMADSVVVPAYRKVGLFQSLMEYALADLSKAGYAFALDLSATAEVSLALLMSGWRMIYLQSAELEIGPDVLNDLDMLRPEQATRSAGLGTLSPPIARGMHLMPKAYRKIRHRLPILPPLFDVTKPAFYDLDKQLEGRTSPNWPDISLSKSARPAEMAALAGNSLSENRISHIRDEAYFRWRYKNPLSEYRFLFWGKRELEGFLVLHTEMKRHDHNTWAYIVDWEVSCQESWVQLILAAIEWGQFKELFLWTATMPDPLRAVLEKEGFTFHNKSGSMRKDLFGENMAVKFLEQPQENSRLPRETDLLDLSSWDLRMIYSDAY